MKRQKKEKCRCGECKILRAMFGPEYETDHDQTREGGKEDEREESTRIV